MIFIVIYYYLKLGINMESKKNIVVTGGSGLVGKHLNKILPNAIYLSSKDCNLMNMNEIDSMMKNYNPRIVIHLAAKVGGILDNINYPVDYIEQNLIINGNLLKKCHEYNVERVIAILSTCIYPDKADKYPMSEKNLFNGPPADTNFSYALSKRAMAVHIESYVKQYQKQWCYLIPCNLYGEHDKFEHHHSHFVSALINKIYKAEDSIELLGSGKPLRQFMYADDLANIIKYFIDNKVNENVNVAPNYTYSIDEIARIGIKSCGKEHLKIIYKNQQLDGQFRKDVDSSKLLNILGDFKFTSLEKGIKKVYDNFSKRYN